MRYFMATIIAAIGACALTNCTPQQPAPPATSGLSPDRGDRYLLWRRVRHWYRISVGERHLGLPRSTVSVQSNWPIGSRCRCVRSYGQRKGTKSA